MVHRPPAVLRAIQPNVILSPTLCFRRHKEGAPFPLFHLESTLSGTQGEGLSLQYKGYAWYSAFLFEQTMSLSKKRGGDGGGRGSIPQSVHVVDFRGVNAGDFGKAY